MKKTLNKNQSNHCKICNKIILGGTYKFNSHLFQHRAVKSRFKCENCPKEFFRKDAYKKHMTTHTGKYPKKYICDHCDRDFVDKRNLVNHLKIHDDTHCRSTLIQYKCMACAMTYCEERLLKYHIRKEHFNLQKYHAKHTSKQQNDKWLEKVRKTGVVVEMKKINNNALTIKRHGAVKTDAVMDKASPKSKKVACQKAEKKKAFQKYMNSIIACEDKSQFSKAICNYCNKEMLKKSLRMHIKERHLKLREHKCGNCNLSFSRHYRMLEHTCKTYQRKRGL